MEVQTQNAHPEFVLLTESIQSGNRKLIDQLYLNKRSEFVKWIYNEYRIAQEEALDIYQAAFVILYEHLLNGKALQVQSSPGTYLFGIGRNLALKNFNSNERHLNHEQRIKWYLESDALEESEDEQEEMKQRVAQLMGNMKEPCQTLLSLFYFENLSIEQISVRMGYKNKDVVKSQKVRCLNYLKEQLVQTSSKK